MDSVMRAEMVNWQLKQSAGEEMAAAAEYRIRAIEAQDAGDETTAELYRHIASEEDGHYRELSQRLTERLQETPYVSNV